MENKSRFNIDLYENLLFIFPNVLANIVFEYGKCYEDFIGKITCTAYDGTPQINVYKITIIRNELYAISTYQHIFIYDKNTGELKREERGDDYVYDIITEWSLQENSGYYPLNDVFRTINDLPKNVWYEDYQKGIITSSDKYIFKCCSRVDKINVYDKLDQYICNIEDVKYNECTYRYKENIIVNNNTLYVIELVYLEDSKRKMYCIHLYNALTFEFIRKFGYTSRKNHDGYSVYHKPLCMAFSENKIFICKNDGEIEIWNSYN
jgi:hypothetical protein